LGEADTATYKATVRLLEQHASGQVALVPVVAVDPAAAPSSDTASITSGSARYPAAATDGSDW
jgi:hypothetical protein